MALLSNYLSWHPRHDAWNVGMGIESHVFKSQSRISLFTSSGANFGQFFLMRFCDSFDCSSDYGEERNLLDAISGSAVYRTS